MPGALPGRRRARDAVRRPRPTRRADPQGGSMSRHASLRSSCTAVLLIAFAAVAHAAPRTAADPWPRYRADGPGPESDSRDRRGFLLGGLGFWSDSSELLSSSWGVGG